MRILCIILSFYAANLALAAPVESGAEEGSNQKYTLIHYVTALQSNETQKSSSKTCNSLFECIYQHLKTKRNMVDQESGPHERLENRSEPVSSQEKENFYCVCTGRFCTSYKEISLLPEVVERSSLKKITEIGREKRNAPENACISSNYESVDNETHDELSSFESPPEMEPCVVVLELLKDNLLNETCLPIDGYIVNVSRENEILAAFQELEEFFFSGPSQFDDEELEFVLHKLVSKLVHEIHLSLEELAEIEILEETEEEKFLQKRSLENEGPGVLPEGIEEEITTEINSFSTRCTNILCRATIKRGKTDRIKMIKNLIGTRKRLQAASASGRTKRQASIDSKNNLKQSPPTHAILSQNGAKHSDNFIDFTLNQYNIGGNFVQNKFPDAIPKEFTTDGYYSTEEYATPEMATTYVPYRTPQYFKSSQISSGLLKALGSMRDYTASRHFPSHRRWKRQGIKSESDLHQSPPTNPVSVQNGGPYSKNSHKLTFNQYNIGGDFVHKKYEVPPHSFIGSVQPPLKDEENERNKNSQRISNPKESTIKENTPETSRTVPKPALKPASPKENSKSPVEVVRKTFRIPLTYLLGITNNQRKLSASSQHSSPFGVFPISLLNLRRQNPTIRRHFPVDGVSFKNRILGNGDEIKPTSPSVPEGISDVERRSYPAALSPILNSPLFSHAAKFLKGIQSASSPNSNPFSLFSSPLTDQDESVSEFPNPGFGNGLAPKPMVDHRSVSMIPTTELQHPIETTTPLTNPGPFSLFNNSLFAQISKFFSTNFENIFSHFSPQTTSSEWLSTQEIDGEEFLKGLNSKLDKAIEEILSSLGENNETIVNGTVVKKSEGLNKQNETEEEDMDSSNLKDGNVEENVMERSSEQDQGVERSMDGLNKEEISKESMDDLHEQDGNGN